MSELTSDKQYAVLKNITDRGFNFAASGKGNDRHGKDGTPWEKQRHVTIGREVGPGFALGQVVKKVFESQGLEPEAAVRELLGAMTYLASAIHLLEEADITKEEAGAKLTSEEGENAIRERMRTEYGPPLRMKLETEPADLRRPRHY